MKRQNQFFAGILRRATLASGAVILAFALSPERAAAQDEDFALGYDAGDTRQDATWVYPWAFYEGIGNLPGTDNFDSYFFPGQPSVCYVWLENYDQTPIYVQLWNSNGDPLDAYYLYGSTGNSHGFYFEDYPDPNGYYLTFHLWGGGPATYGCGFSYP